MPPAEEQTVRRPAVVIDGVSKTFKMPTEQVHTLKERALHPFRRTTTERLEALQDVSFAVEAGEFFGIVGRNGSGKSTLLKCMAGIYRLDEGQIFIDGRLSTFIELGVGFNPDLAALDNVTINGVMMGLTPREAAGRFEDVIEFAELEQFTDMKLKNYSSGMQVRLAFSVAIQVDADTLLIDEVLAVGDAAFQQKCFDVFYRMRDEGRTVLLVTHDMSAVTRFCNRAALLDKGQLVDFGDPEKVARSYLDLNFGNVEAEGATLADEARSGDGLAAIEEAWFENAAGERTDVIEQGKPARFVARANFREASSQPEWRILFENADHHPLFATSSTWAGLATGEVPAGGQSSVAIDFEVPFAPGRIYATPAVAHRGSGDRFMDRRERFASAVVTGTHHSGGLVMVPHDVSVGEGA
ncbi:MAG: ABC transporter ATP-binding protein [Solirubrobacterales bacterium]